MKIWLAAVVFAAASLPAHAGGEIVIPSPVSFTDSAQVDPAAKAECALPERVAEQIAIGLRAAGFEPKLVDKPTPKSGPRVLQLKIESATAKGNAMVGRIKAVTVIGTLYEDGKPGPSFVATRGSGGGAFAGFKKSCDIFGRCAAAIGQDVARWLASPVDGAKLGDAR